jgi:hypothetical protein
VVGAAFFSVGGAFSSVGAAFLSVGDALCLVERPIDHVPFAWQDLEEITAAFERLGLTPEYGGVHDNDVTHMSVLGFDDQTYVELIAERADGDHDFWPAQIRADAGPAAWCVRVPDIVAECEHVLRSGRPVQGPYHGSRERADGRLVEWDRAVFGDEASRLRLPFAIEDRTPLSYRVTPSPSVAGGPLTGIEQVVIAVTDLNAATRQFRELYRYPQPVVQSVSPFGTVASFPGEPVALATPDEDDDWLSERLAAFPDSPCAVLLGTESPDDDTESTGDTDGLAAARESFPLRESQSWPTGHVAFFDSDLLGHRLGVLDRGPVRTTAT